MGGVGSGRRSRIKELRDAAEILHDAAPEAARYLRDVTLCLISKPSWPRIEVCKFIIEQALGKARVRAEITGAGGAPLTMQALVILAQSPAPEPDKPGDNGDKSDKLKHLCYQDSANDAKNCAVDVAEVVTRALTTPPTTPGDADLPPGNPEDKAQN